MEIVKTGMQHGDLSLDAYTQVGILPPSLSTKIDKMEHNYACFYKMVNWLTDWLIDWVIDWLIDR